MGSGFLVILHTPTNAGYAIAPLERVFLRVARNLTHGDSEVHFAYRDLHRGPPDTLPDGFANLLALDIRDGSPGMRRKVKGYVRKQGISTVLAFDAPVRLPTYSALREGGAQLLVSYYGAPMSSVNRGLKLLMKRLQVWMTRHGPDHYILESEAMRETAVQGRGVPARDTSVIPLGVDPDRFAPHPESDYAHREFSIPPDRAVVVYSGHMERRKGVHVIVQAAVELIARRGRTDVHFVLLGNRSGEEQCFLDLYHETAAANHITFGGYRHDIPKIFASADIGCIASTGWDSFTMSSVEMAAAGLPIVVSGLQGLRETVEPGKTGLQFPPGDFAALADRLQTLLEDRALRDSMACHARQRVLRAFTVEHQVATMTELIRGLQERWGLR